MIRAELYKDSDKELWNNFIQNSKNGIFMFNRNFMEYHKDRFTDNSLLFYDDDKLVAIFPASIKEGILSSHGGLTYGGFITSNDMKQHHMNDCFTALKEYAASNGIKEIIYKHIPHIYHKQPAEEDIYSLYFNKAEIFKIEASTVVDLQNPLKMQEIRKRQAKKDAKNSVEVKESNDFEAFFPENIKLVAAFYQEKMIAGTVLFIYENAIHTQYLAANEQAREIGALDLTITNVIEQYKDSKKWLDFGISTEDAGRFLNEGLISQKEGFGGRTNIYQTWKIKI